MKSRIMVVALALMMIMGVQSAMAWGTWGHHITVFIAEKHLSPEAKEKCQHYLKHSLPHYSVWQDNWRNSDPFKESTYWHMNNVDKDFTTTGKNGDISRDVTTQLERIVKEMSNGKYRNLSDSLVAVNLKFIIHMVGDMHCPCHIAYAKECGYKSVAMYVKGKRYGRHSFWDASPQLMHPRWKADKFLAACDTYTPKQIKRICKGTPASWSLQNASKIVNTYTMWEEDTELTQISEEQRESINGVMYEQLAYGGYRLAHILNNIFSNK